MSAGGISATNAPYVPPSAPTPATDPSGMMKVLDASIHAEADMAIKLLRMSVQDQAIQSKMEIAGQIIDTYA